MPFLRKRHERNLSTASSGGKSTTFEVDENTSSFNNSEDDLSKALGADYSSSFYIDFISKSSYNDDIASSLKRTKSRLSKTLQDLLLDHSSLVYFIQFLESREMGYLIKFWLDAESFRASAISRCETKKQHVSLDCSDTNLCKKSLSEQCENIKTNAITKESINHNDSSHHPTTKTSSLQKSVVMHHEDILCKLKKSIQKDAVSIYSKYISQDATHLIGLSDVMRNDIIAKICSEDGEVDDTCFVNAQNFVIDYLEKNHFPDFLNSIFHCKLQIDLLTSESVYLADILYNEFALFYFMEFMEQETANRLIEFWLITHNFYEQQISAQKTGKYNGAVAQEDAMVIYDKYFSLQATCPLGFNDAIRFEIEQNICTEAGPSPECFQKPVALVMHLLESEYLSQFLRSQLFYKYLSELANTIEGGRFHFGRKKRSGSESSGSEHSAQSSNTNTLLAMDGLKPGVSSSMPSKVLRNIEYQDMSIDTGKFTNPDDLWKRDFAGKLEMGKINKYGQFKTEFIPQPDKKESKISKAVRKLVSKDEQQKEEDMAWKVAEMIIRDVCSVTQKDDDSDFTSFSSKLS